MSTTTLNYYGYPTYNHTHSITTYPLTNGISYAPTKEPELSTLEKIKQQRKELLERGRIERMYAEYDALALNDEESGTVWGAVINDEFEALVKHDDDVWSITGGPQRATLEDIIAYLIGKDVEASDLQ